MKPFTAPLGERVLRGNLLQAIIVVACSAGFYLFGYDQGIANALLSNPDFFLEYPVMTDATKQGAILGLFVIGAMGGCLANSAIGNRLGRRPVLFVAAIGTLLGAGLQSGSRNLAMFIVSRLINGFFVGVLTSIVPPYMGEVSRTNIRGLFVALDLVLGSAGLMTAFWVSYGFRNTPGPIGWRMPLALQAMFVLITIACIPFIPESPRWLMEAGRRADSLAVLTRLHGREYAEKAAAEIEEAIALEHATAVTSWLDIFSNNKQCFRYRTILAISVNSFQQFTGVNMATYYAGTIFLTALNMPPDKGQLALGGLGISGHVACIFGCFVMIEYLGRVRTMMLGAATQSIAMILLAGGIAHIDNPAGGYVGAVGIYLFIMAFSATWLPCGWLYGAEVTPLAIRLKAAALGNTLQYAFNFMIVQVTPIGITRIGYKYYIPFAISNAVLVPLLYFYFPEISQLSLEEIDELFSDGKVRMRRSPYEKIGHLHLDQALEAGKPVDGPQGSFENEKTNAEYVEHQ